MKRFKSILRAFAAIGFFSGAGAVVATGGCSTSSSSACADLCPAYITCGAANGSGIKLPLFCSADLEGTCEPTCADVADGLGDSKSKFLSCAECVLQYDAAHVCDKGKAEDTGKVSCADTCNLPGVGEASSKFYDDFATQYEARLRTATCTGTGEKRWAADDPAIVHGVGSANGDGTWSCATFCDAFPFSAGPYVALPPGNYEAGVSGLSVTPQNPADTVEFDINSQSSMPNTVAQTKLPASTLPGEVTMSFTLTQTVPDIEVVVRSYIPITVGSVFIRRL
jgi:hypothetical protein